MHELLGAQLTGGGDGQYEGAALHPRDNGGIRTRRVAGEEPHTRGADGREGCDNGKAM